MTNEEYEKEISNEAFVEQEHPRDEDGKFTDKDGSNSRVERASSRDISTSCNFSPGRIPMVDTSQPDAIDSAKSIRRMLGIFGTNISPPCIWSNAFITRRTPCSRVIQKRVIRSSVTVILPSSRC